jgi:putative protein-disulfide isomerase
MNTLYYAHDPMCSWCWAFRPTWEHVLTHLPEDMQACRLLGGLAPDSDVPMPIDMQRYLEQTWRRIEQVVPGTRFNFDFWRDCQPRRSTYPACRAVIAACAQVPAQEEAVILAIQEAYYLQARKPSDDDTPVAVACGLGLDSERFANDLNAVATRTELERQIDLTRSLGAFGFPSLILERGGHRQPVPINYNEPLSVLGQLAA